MENDRAKLFVGGISRETSEDSLKEYFGKYGTVLESVIAKDRITKSPRGFGFVWFSDASSVDKALNDSHVILGRTVEVKKAIPRSGPKNQQQSNGLCESSGSNDSIKNQIRTKKIFVGGLSASLTEEEFKNYFERFGTITDVVVMHDSTTHRPRGFGFITFASEDSVENVVRNSFHELNGRLVEVKRAVPKEENNSNGNYYMKNGDGRGSPNNNYHPGFYPPYSPGYWVPPSYAPFPGYNAWYPFGGYGGVSNGFAPVFPGDSPRACVFPYGGAFFYPTYMNGAGRVFGLATGGNKGVERPG